MTLPFISIVLPIRNEEKYIEQTLLSILQQNYPADRFEILISDGISTDATREIIAKYQAKHDNIFLFDNPAEIVPTGLNILIPQAKGKILIRVDGHCVIDQNYIRNCVRHLDSPAVWGVGGPMTTIGEDFLSKVIAQGMSSKFGVGNSSFRTEKDVNKFVDSVPFPAYRKKTILKVGGYDEELVRNQDDEYNYRIREAGGKILLADDVTSIYYSRGTLRKLWKQYIQYGYWKIRVMQKHPKQMRLRQFIPASFVAALLISIFLAIFLPVGGILLALVAGSYILANILASILTASHSSWKYIPLLPVVFAILHLSYGIGFWSGLFKFWNRWGDTVGKTPSLQE